MSVEVPQLALKVAAAKAESERRYKAQNPRVTELPAGLYDKRQLERYLKAAAFIQLAAETAFGELGIGNYRIERDFTWSKKHPVNKGVTFRIRFSDSNEEEVDFESEDHKVVEMDYDPGGRINNESLHLRCFLLVPYKKRHGTWFNLKDVVSYASSPDATESQYALVGTFDITEENLADMVRIGIAGARTWR